MSLKECFYLARQVLTNPILTINSYKRVKIPADDILLSLLLLLFFRERERKRERKKLGIPC